MIPINHIHQELLLSTGYVFFLLLLSICLELAARFSHRRILRFKTIGFQYHKHINAWECTEGQYLWQHKIDHEKKLAHYRADRHKCNKCSVKHACTDSEEGREIIHSLESWPYTEIGHFQHVISFVLILIAGFILGVELFRHHTHGNSEIILVGVSAVAIIIMGLRMLRRLQNIHHNSYKIDKVKP
jgi:hypothetical protein